MNRKPRFIQITESDNMLLSLDENGDVWAYCLDNARRKYHWSKLDMTREIENEPRN